jgi:hypothetical protein
MIKKRPNITPPPYLIGHTMLSGIKVFLNQVLSLHVFSTSSLSDNRNHIIVFSQYFRYRRQWKQVRAGRYKRLAADSRAMPGNGIHGRTDKTACLLPTRRVQGKLHSREHREKSGTAYSTATVKRNPQKKGKFRLCIDGMPILEWFKMNLKSLRKSWL